MQRNIKVIVVEPDKEGYETTIRNTLKDKKKLVGRNIEYVYLDDKILI